MQSKAWFSKDDKKWKGAHLRILFAHVRERYKTEDVETIRSPEIFWNSGGDCDCQAAFWLGFFNHLYPAKLNKTLWDNFFLVYCGKNRIQHVFLKYENSANNHKILFDSLPGMKYNTNRKYGVQEVKKCEFMQ